ncbi:DUF5988 family protein [Amycolatopsis sulphurea]|uniref:DUF5988 family protein n=1 Tax=Amycolatopsis sulphurea TaxID=76022 RepID=UPI00369FC984
MAWTEWTAPGQLRVLLEGGPEDVSPEYLSDCGLDSQVKVPHRSGWEHYEFSGVHREHEGGSLPVFHWIYRTRVAE